MLFFLIKLRSVVQIHGKFSSIKILHEAGYKNVLIKKCHACYLSRARCMDKHSKLDSIKSNILEKSTAKGTPASDRKAKQEVICCALINVP